MTEQLENAEIINSLGWVLENIDQAIESKDFGQVRYAAQMIKRLKEEISVQRHEYRARELDLLRKVSSEIALLERYGSEFGYVLVDGIYSALSHEPAVYVSFSPEKQNENTQGYMLYESSIDQDLMRFHEKYNRVIENYKKFQS